ncbi:MAG TPA: hypothetical protein VMB81_16040, partial [Candidatus Sulfotelmatobacter sp.]|nr:hypothetical protein [Candidatus Sulfotelmatobacter sp.]
MTLGVDWTILVDLRIDAPPDRIAVDYLLLHPEHGVALVTVGAMRATATVDAAVIEGFRRFLLGRGFDTFFPGYLPIVRLTVAPQEAAVAGRLVVRAFADVPRLTIKERDWAEAIAIVLTASGSDAAPAEPPDPDQNLELRRDELPASDMPPRPARAQPAAAPHLADIARREDAEPAAAAAPARPVRAPACVASGAAPRPSGSLFARLRDGAARLNLRVPLSAAVARQPVDRAHPTAAPNRFEAAQSQTAEREAVRRETRQRETARPATTQSATTQSATTQSATTQSATTQREAARREIGQSETARREAPPPATTQRETAHPEVAQPETAQRETTQREAGQHETVRFEIAQPATTQHETVQPEGAQPETGQRETTQREVGQHESTQPAINQRETAPSETPQREIARPEITIAPARARDPKMTMAAKTAPVA